MDIKCSHQKGVQKKNIESYSHENKILNQIDPFLGGLFFSFFLLHKTSFLWLKKNLTIFSIWPIFYSLHWIAVKTRRRSIKLLLPPVNPPQTSLLSHRFDSGNRGTLHFTLSPLGVAVLDFRMYWYRRRRTVNDTSVLIKMSAPKTIPKDAQVMFL